MIPTRPAVMTPADASGQVLHENPFFFPPEIKDLQARCLLYLLTRCKVFQVQTFCRLSKQGRFLEMRSFSREESCTT